MASYFKSLFLSLALFAVMYLSLSFYVHNNVGQPVDSLTLNIINMLSYSCWLISAFYFSYRNKKLGVLNGAILGALTLVVIIPANIDLIRSATIDVTTLLVPFLGMGIVLGVIGGGLYDIQQFIKRKTSNKALVRDAGENPPASHS